MFKNSIMRNHSPRQYSIIHGSNPYCVFEIRFRFGALNVYSMYRKSDSKGKQKGRDNEFNEFKGVHMLRYLTGGHSSSEMALKHPYIINTYVQYTWFICQRSGVLGVDHLSFKHNVHLSLYVFMEVNQSMNQMDGRMANPVSSQLVTYHKSGRARHPLVLPDDTLSLT